MTFHPLNKLMLLFICLTVLSCRFDVSETDSTSESLAIDTIGIDTATFDTAKRIPPTEKGANIADIFSLYLENKMAFNQSYEDKSFEFVGEITEITKSMMDCSVIRFEIYTQDNEIVGFVNCLNCPNLVDKWKSKLMKLKAGDQVRIRGIYSTALTDDTMTFKNCKLIF